MWTNTTAEMATQKVAARLLKLLDRPAERLEFARYHKTGGWMCSFQIPLNATTHNDAVVEVLTLDQHVAYSWTLTGDVFDDLEGWSNEARVSGVTNVQWQLCHEDQVDGQGGDTAEC